MWKSHFNDEFLVLLGPIISRIFTCSNAKKKINLKKTKGACSSPISMGKYQCQQNTSFTIVLTLASLGDMTQIELILIAKSSKEGDITSQYHGRFHVQTLLI